MKYIVRKYRLPYAFFSLLLCLLTVFNTSVADADIPPISQDDLTSILNNTPFYDPDAQQQNCTNATATNPTQPTVTLSANATEDQKIAQTFDVGFDVKALGGAQSAQSAILSIVQKYHIGGIYLTDITGADTQGFTQSYFSKLNQAAGVPLTISSDEEGGLIDRFSHANNPPQGAEQMGGMSTSQVQTIGSQFAKDLTGYGVTMDLAPVLDTGGGIITSNDRSFSSNPNTVVEKAGAFADGLQSGGITPVFKHFPGFGGTSSVATGPGSDDTDLYPVQSSAADFANNIIPYKQLLSQYPKAGVMLSNLYVTAPNFDPSVPASISKKAVDYLRNTLSFKGLITTDDLSALSLYGSQAVAQPDAVTDALEAGVDMPLFGFNNVSSEAGVDSGMQAIISAVEQAIKGGTLSVNTVEAADQAVITSKNNFSSSSTGSGSGSGSCCATNLATTGTPTTNGAPNGVIAYDFFVKNGFTPAGAAGIVGNFTEESAGVNPEQPQGGQWVDPRGSNGSVSYSIPENVPAAQLPSWILTDSSFGWGIAQWTPPVDTSSPASKIISYADQTNAGTSVNELSYQLQYFLQDFQKNYSSVYSQLKQETDPVQAATDFLNGYEKGNPSSERQSAAVDYYNLAEKGTPLPTTGPSAIPISYTNGDGTAGICTGGGTQTGSGTYQNPLRDLKNIVPARIDEGVDYEGSGPIYALGNGIVDYWNSPRVWIGGTFMSYILSDGPAQGKRVYVAENCTPNPQLKVGSNVTSSTVICTEKDAYPFIETGWGNQDIAPSDTAGAYYVYHPNGTATAYGQNFSDLLKSLGAPPGIYQYPNQQGGVNLTGAPPAGYCASNPTKTYNIPGNTQPSGYLPCNWPTW
ncbi:MAG TPA: phage tail tip lysozyme [Verrucomicrobiae bacterium]|nr:phage tail tip lysozyme [Verrucomicrobiae bacterium]